MPRVDGFGVLRELNFSKIKTPVIVSSSVNQREIVIKAFSLGVKSYLVKPINKAGVFKKTLEILRANF